MLALAEKQKEKKEQRHALTSGNNVRSKTWHQRARIISKRRHRHLTLLSSTRFPSRLLMLNEPRISLNSKGRGMSTRAMP